MEGGAYSIMNLSLMVSYVPVRSPGARVAAVESWPEPRGSWGRPGGVAGPLGLVVPPWKRGRSLYTVVISQKLWVPLITGLNSPLDCGTGLFNWNVWTGM